MVTRQKLTVEQYLALPEEKPYLEYIDGEAVPKMAPDFGHMVIAGRLIVGLNAYAPTGTLGPEGRVQFDSQPDTFLLPDVAYWAPGRPLKAELAMAPPTLAIEILSPGQRMEDIRRKCRFMREHGVPVCWLVDPETRTAEVFEGALDAAPVDVLESEYLPGFTLPVTELFAVLDQ